MNWTSKYNVPRNMYYNYMVGRLYRRHGHRVLFVK